MINRNHLKEFIETNKEEILIDYRDKLYNNLQELIKKEEKQTLILLILVTLYFFVDYKSLSNISLGILTITNPENLVIQLIPILFCTLLFNLFRMGRDRQDLHESLKQITSKLTSNLINSELKDELLNNTLYRLYLPNSIGNFASSITARQPIILTFIGFILLLPFFIIGLVPFFIIFLMLSNLWQTQIESTPGIISFSISLWVSISIIFFFFIPQQENNLSV
ncbi:hypothetical protein BD847_2410 [Flavobacterium cutihirudinis]|uniref:Uncharacterized protein n=1 Tax=Flavobacterium cutihirudinis TaxID=1265740 RepID=A0A3D9FTU9_9FLAO|nr:hypothetical protein [Flavobacterium cutihirudinis]RED23359.1 hypothetical protein BD847_2410 [Flavobacterium cutihirudinis]